LNRDFWEMVEIFDTHLDDKVSQPYKEQPLAQHWARVAKVDEEAGEAIAELILATGQNPRKAMDDAAWDRLLGELADTALTAIYAIQHFTKDAERTAGIVLGKARYHGERAGLIEPVKPEQPPKPPVTDLMAALEASLGRAIADRQAKP